MVDRRATCLSIYKEQKESPRVRWRRRTHGTLSASSRSRDDPNTDVTRPPGPSPCKMGHTLCLNNHPRLLLALPNYPGHYNHACS
jgi:hypothetical protein